MSDVVLPTPAPRIRRGRGPYFVQVPFALLERPDADAATIATYAALRYFADFSSAEGARPSDRQAAMIAGVSVRTFADRRERLRRWGWVSWQSGKGAGRPNVYLVHQSLEPEGSAAGADPGLRQVQTSSAGGADRGLRVVPTTYSHSPRAIQKGARARHRPTQKLEGKDYLA